MKQPKPLPAKLRAPALDAGRLLRRDRLFARIDTVNAPCLWVCGPPGAGKTVLVRTWLAARGIDVLWYRVDAGDADPAVLPHYLRQAVAAMVPEVEPLLPDFSIDRLGGLDAFASDFFTPLFDALADRGALLVLDNVESAQPAGAFMQLLAGAAEGLSARGLRMVCIGRALPNGPLARLCAHDQLSLIDGDSMAFDLEETRALLALRAWRSAPRQSDAQADAQADSLWRWSGGWVSALVLATVSGRASTPAAHPTAEPPRVGAELFAYLAESVLAREGEAVQQRLLAAALMPAFSAAMADEVAAALPAPQSLDSAALFERLVAGSLFTSVRRRDGAAPLYEFHALLRKMLLDRGLAQWSAGQRQALLSLAAQALLDDGQTEAAARVLIEAGDTPALAALIHRQADALLAAARHRTLAGWLAALPGEWLARDPWLLCWQGQCLVPYDPQAARATLAQAVEGFAATAGIDSLVGACLCCCVAIESIAIEWRDFSEFDAWIDRAEALQRNPSPPALAPAMAGRFACAMHVALLWRRPWDAALPAWRERALAGVRALPDANTRLLAGAALFHDAAVHRGDHREMMALHAWLRPSPALDGLSPLSAALACLLDASAGWMRGRCQDALAHVERGRALCVRHKIRLFGSLLYCHELYALATAGRVDEAAAAVERIRATELDPRRELDAAHVDFITALIELQRDRLDAARRHLDAANAAVARVGGPHQWSHGLLSQAQLRHAEGASRCETRRLLVAGLRAQRGARCNSLWFEALACRAFFELDAGGSGLPALRRAFSLGAANDLLSYLWFRPAMMARLCALALRHGIEPDYARRLIASHDLQPPELLPEWPWPVRVHVQGDGCSGDFQVLVRDHPLPRHRRTPDAPLKLLQALVVLGRRVPPKVLPGHLLPLRQVRRDALAHRLRPRANPASTEAWVDQNLKRLRQQLGCADAVLTAPGVLMLNPARVWVVDSAD